MSEKKQNKLKGIRVGLGYTQKEIANELGITFESYQKKESGVVPFTEKQKIALIKILGLDIYQTNDFLFAGQLPVGNAKSTIL